MFDPDIIKVVDIPAFRPHPNADRLKIADVGTMQVVTGKDAWPGEFFHILPEAFAPREVWEKLGVWQFVSHRAFNGEEYGRVRPTRLRGEFSYGFLVPSKEMPEEIPSRLEKFEPDTHVADTSVPRFFADPSMEREHSLFPCYPKIPNYHREPELIKEGEYVTITEKIHGTNSRIGLVRTSKLHYEVMIGSNSRRRAFGVGSLYEKPLHLHPKLIDLMRNLAGDSVVVYGEIYGKGIQDLSYGADTPEYRVFDVKVEGHFLQHGFLRALCGEHDVPVAPRLYNGAYSHLQALELAKGNTLLEGGHIREGVVVSTPDGKRLKFISEDYLVRDGGTEEH